MYRCMFRLAPMFSRRSLLTGGLASVPRVVRAQSGQPLIPEFLDALFETFGQDPLKPAT